MTPKIAVIILCRYSSSRLPGKILKELNGYPVLFYILQRIKKVFPLENILVATSTDASDKPILEYCKNNTIPVFAGDLNNVANRFLQAAQSLDATYAIRINGDNLFVDIPLLQEFKSLLEKKEFDFVSNVKGRTYPKGMSIEAVKIDYYRHCYNQFKSPDHFEHVTAYFYEHPPERAHYFYNDLLPEAAGVQLAIDTQEDFAMANNILLQMEGDPTDYQLKDIFTFYKQQKDESL